MELPPTNTKGDQRLGCALRPPASIIVIIELRKASALLSVELVLSASKAPVTSLTRHAEPNALHMRWRPASWSACSRGSSLDAYGHATAAGLDDDMLPADGINVDRCQSAGKASTRKSASAAIPNRSARAVMTGRSLLGSQVTGASRTGARDHERSRGPRPRARGSAGAFV